jgi:hypothetical protein
MCSTNLSAASEVDNWIDEKNGQNDPLICGGPKLRQGKVSEDWNPATTDNFKHLFVALKM